MKKFDFFKIYRVATYLFMPLIWVYLAIRKQRGKEDLTRFNERAGASRVKRPEGKLLWFHGASVGETISMRPLIDKILSENPDVHIMVTSGTKTSSQMLKEKLPDRAFHQYIPVDYYPYVKRFMAHFKPDVAFWFESEFWPNLLKEAKDNNVKMVLMNGRVSDRSFSRWRLFNNIIKEILSLFDMVIAQSEESKERLEILGQREVLYLGNLKFAASFKMDINQEKIAKLSEKIGERPLFLAASTHKGEEEMIGAVHTALKKDFPDLLTIIVPRHPNRSEEIRKDLVKASLVVKTRSLNEEITTDSDVYLADTIGEMGVFYSLAKIVFVGGSLVKFGGQNMIEPMYLGDSVLIGPHAFNFRDIVKEGLKEKALIEVKDDKDLTEKVAFLLKSPKDAEVYQETAKKYARKFGDICGNIYDEVEPLINENS